LRSGPFEGPAIVKPPALLGDTYFILIVKPSDPTRNMKKNILIVEDEDVLMAGLFNRGNYYFLK
jgi:hypothetical protein